MPKPLPALIAPQLATLVERPPTGPHWMFEVKLDGYHTITAADGKRVRCYKRTGLGGTIPATASNEYAYAECPSCSSY